MITTFAVYVEDKPGVLTRVSSLFRRRAFNIESLTVGHTDKPGVSRMTIVVDTDELGARRIEAHTYKLVNVLRVENITAGPGVYRDLAMIKVAASAESRTHIMQLVDVFRARVAMARGARSTTAQGEAVTGPSDEDQNVFHSV